MWRGVLVLFGGFFVLSVSGCAFFLWNADRLIAHRAKEGIARVLELSALPEGEKGEGVRLASALVDLYREDRIRPEEYEAALAPLLTTRVRPYFLYLDLLEVSGLLGSDRAVAAGSLARLFRAEEAGLLGAGEVDAVIAPLDPHGGGGGGPPADAVLRRVARESDEAMAGLDLPETKEPYGNVHLREAIAKAREVVARSRAEGEGGPGGT